MKSPTDPIWQLLAKQAGVRPPHVFHVAAAMAEARKAFDAEAFALFCQLELRYVIAIVDALTARGIIPKRAPTKREATERVQATRLSPDFQAPIEWLAYAREKRFWTEAEALDEFAAFIEWTRRDGKAFVDWSAAWQGHVRRSHRPSGTHSPAAIAAMGPEAKIAELDRRAEGWDRIGRTDEAAQCRRDAENLRRANVVPIKRTG